MSKLRIPLRYLANLLTAGDEYAGAQSRSNACWRCAPTCAHVTSTASKRRSVLAQVDLDRATVEDMYRILALAAYEDRFVIPTTHREYAENAYDLRGTCGFSFGNGCSGGTSDTGLFGKSHAYAWDESQGGGMSMQSLRALSALLCYPTAETMAALDELAEVLRADPLLPPDRLAALDNFIAELRTLPLLDAEERYVALFDRNRSLSLHLYEHVHGESRDRGQAMVRLAALYALHGLEFTARELPDYLPLYLEFLSQLPERAARSMLAEAAHVSSRWQRSLKRARQRATPRCCAPPKPWPRGRRPMRR